MSKKRRDENAGLAKLRTVKFLVVPPITELDLVGPMTVFQGANFALQAAGRAAAYRMQVVTAGNGEIVAGINDLRILADAAISETTGDVDTLLVVGHSAAVDNDAMRRAVRWLRETAPTARRVGSICVGAFVLAAAGLLNERRATTHWRYCRELQTKYPRVKVEENPVFVCDGKFYTSAGVTAGMDLALKLVEDDAGNEIAQTVARHLVVYLRRPAEQPQLSRALRAQKTEKRNLRELQVWIDEHLSERLDVETLARRAAMSERNFARVFTREFGVTPARYVLARKTRSGAAGTRNVASQSGRNRRPLRIRHSRSDAARILARSRRYARSLSSRISANGLKDLC